MGYNGPGRRRDPEVDRRALGAAVDLFGDVGWSGFTVDAVAKRAGVGKAALYRRWESKDALLVDALSVHLNLVEDVDTGSLRGDLAAVAGQLMAGFLGVGRRALMRLNVESGLAEPVSDRFAEWQRSQVRTARAAVHRAKDRGELADDVDTTLVMDLVCGAAVNHASAAPVDRLDEVRAGADDFVREIVDVVLVGLRVTAGADQERTVVR